MPAGAVSHTTPASAAIGGATTLGLPPAAPGALTATTVSATQINLAWADNSNNESLFKVDRCVGVNCTNFAQVAQVGAGVTTFINTGLARNTTYRYRVRAFNSAGIC